MLRSLFIGFLILSALTSKGAGVQSDYSAKFSAAMLLDLYNAVTAYADRQVDFSDAKSENALRSNNTDASFVLEQLIRTTAHESQIAWASSPETGFSGNLCCGSSERPIVRSCPGEIHACGSDPSPPCFGDSN